jgi:hypothetical protein
VITECWKGLDTVTCTFAVTDQCTWNVDGTDYLQVYTLLVDVQTLIRGWEVVVEEVAFVFGPVLQSGTFFKQCLSELFNSRRGLRNTGILPSRLPLPQ